MVARSPISDQSAVTRRYDRNARFYDLLNAPMEVMGGMRHRRDRVLSGARGRVLEVGIGTGRNLGHYPAGVDLVGIEISSGMLRRAAKRLASAGRAPSVHLERADVASLPFPDGSFDTATATCVFCSVADPIAGLREVDRVVRPDGAILLLEHVRPRGRVMGWIFDRLSPAVRRLIGPEINRRTEENVRAAGLQIESVRRSGVWREIVARPSGLPRAPDVTTEGGTAVGRATRSSQEEQ